MPRCQNPGDRAASPALRQKGSAGRTDDAAAVVQTIEEEVEQEGAQGQRPGWTARSGLRLRDGRRKAAAGPAWQPGDVLAQRLRPQRPSAGRRARSAAPPRPARRPAAASRRAQRQSPATRCPGQPPVPIRYEAADQQHAGANPSRPPRSAFAQRMLLELPADVAVGGAHQPQEIDGLAVQVEAHPGHHHHRGQTPAGMTSPAAAGQQPQRRGPQRCGRVGPAAASLDRGARRLIAAAGFDAPVDVGRHARG